MPQEYLDLLSVAGESYWDQKEKLKKVLQGVKVHCPEGARLVIRENEHDLGPYPSLVVIYDSEVTREVLERVFALEELALSVADALGVDV